MESQCRVFDNTTQLKRFAASSTMLYSNKKSWHSFLVFLLVEQYRNNESRLSYCRHDFALICNCKSIAQFFVTTVRCYFTNEVNSLRLNKFVTTINGCKSTIH